MHPDGFRFDLAPTLARQEGGYDKVAAFLMSRVPTGTPTAAGHPHAGKWSTATAMATLFPGFPPVAARVGIGGLWGVTSRC
jgi:pullulanase/glycogen debranching enzyme